MKLLCALTTLVAIAAIAAPSGVVAPAAANTMVTSVSDGCGVQLLKVDGTAWQCTFDDEFDGTALDRTKWIPQTVFVTGSSTAYACYRDDPSNVNVKDGVLNLTLLKLTRAAPCAAGLPPTRFMSGMVSTWHLFSQQYGRFEARIMSTRTTVRGLHEAFWMWPDDRYPSDGTVWPTAGEIDVAETYSNAPSYVVPYLHYSADSGGMQIGVNTNRCTAYRGVWNTYTMVWSPSRIEVFVNGKSCLVNTSGDPAFQKHYLIDLTQSLGAGNDSWVWNTRIPATMKVDYVRVWK